MPNFLLLFKAQDYIYSCISMTYLYSRSTQNVCIWNMKILFEDTTPNDQIVFLALLISTTF